MKSNSIRLRKNAPRGSVLILVLALLVLLALMGTAFISVARLDAAAVTGTGGAAGPGGYEFGPTDRSLADTLLNRMKDHTFAAIVDDVFNDQARNPTTFTGFRRQYRRPVATPTASDRYRAYDFCDVGTARALSDSFLASRLPERITAGSATSDPTWPVISAWLPQADATGSATVTWFSSPGTPAAATRGYTTNSLTRFDARPTFIIVNPSVGQLPNDPNNRTRVYPALFAGANPVLAGDTDGDGIADAGLFGIDVGQNGTFSQADRQADVNGTFITYYGAIRVVDNSAAINVNTAFSRGGDYTIGATGATPALLDPDYGADLPNYGFFRSNIGLIEMFSANADLTNLLQERVGSLAYADPTPYNDNGSFRTDFNYISLGDTLDMNVARRVRSPGRNGTARMGSFDPVDTAPALKHRGVLLDPDPGINRVPLENKLRTATYTSAANYATDPTKMFRYYPADQGYAWFQYNLDYIPTNTDPAVQIDPDGRPLNIRSLLTATNALTNHVPAMSMSTLPNEVKSTTPTTVTDLVQKMTDWGDPWDGNANAGLIGKASANTSSFADLWRAYWQVMADPANPTNPQDAGKRAFSQTVSRDSGSPTTLTAQERLMLRSAIAAVNTEDLRDIDTDVNKNGDVRFRQIALSATKNATVYGTEKQPFFSRARIDQNSIVTLRLYNPFNAPATRAFPCLRLVKATRTGGVMTLTDITELGNVTGWTTSIGAESFVDVTVSAVEDLAGKEIYLMRSLKATPAATNPVRAVDLDPLNMVPLDVVDLQGLTTAGVLASGTGFQFERAAGWGCVYPGLYTLAPLPIAGVVQPRHSAMQAALVPISPTRTIQLNNVDWPGPAKVGALNVFPFNGFARDGDLLQVPFIGAYRIENSSFQINEMNPVTMDSEFVRELNSDDNGAPGYGIDDEQIGRFGGDMTAMLWASDLFDYVTTTQNPKDDALPNISTDAYSGTAPIAIANEGGIASTGEDSVPVEGRVNINTAPWRVLAMLPLAVNPTTGRINKAATETIATAIVTNRQGAGGPFTSLFDLNKRVPLFQSMNGVITATYNPAGPVGDLTPMPSVYPAPGPAVPTGIATDGVANDFEPRYAQLNRMSNLVSTRSDSFTVYILVQGWRDVATQITVNPATGVATPVTPLQPMPRLVVEKRVAYVVDRSAIRAGKSAITDLRLDGK